MKVQVRGDSLKFSDHELGGVCRTTDLTCFGVWALRLDSSVPHIVTPFMITLIWFSLSWYMLDIFIYGAGNEISMYIHDTDFSWLEEMSYRQFPHLLMAWYDNSSAQN